MALDGITLHCLAHELNSSLQNQRIGKIAQPEKEELLFTFKIRERVPSLRLLHIGKQAQSADRAEFLYGAAQIYRERQSPFRDPARTGTGFMLFHRTLK